MFERFLSFLQFLFLNIFLFRIEIICNHLRIALKSDTPPPHPLTFIRGIGAGEGYTLRLWSVWKRNSPGHGRNTKMFSRSESITVRENRTKRYKVAYCLGGVSVHVVRLCLHAGSSVISCHGDGLIACIPTFQIHHNSHQDRAVSKYE